jgi:general secretion pathway protein D
MNSNNIRRLGLAAIAVLAGCSSVPQTLPSKPAASPKWTVGSSERSRAAARIEEDRSEGSPGAPSAQAARSGRATDYFSNALPAAPAAAPSPVSAAGEGQVRLDFRDAEIRSVVDAVLGDMLKLSYTIAPQVQGKVTLRTGAPISRAAALSALEAALGTVSAALLARDGSYEVVPVELAPQRLRGASRTSPQQRAAPGYALDIVPLRYVSAREMQRVLDAVSPKGSVLQADEVHNHLVITGSSTDREALLRTINGFDTDSMKDKVFAFYKLENVSAEQLVAELKEVFQPPLEWLNTRVRLVPLERIRVLMGISSNRGDLEVLESWVRKLDLPPQTGERRLFVYQVRYGNAKDLSATLQLVLTGEGSNASRGTGASGLAPAGRPRSDLTNPLAAGVQEGPRPASLRIVANEDNNSLVMFGTDAEFRLVRNVMSKLDVPQRQVMIEAILAEVTLSDDLQYGVQWFFDSGKSVSTFSSLESGSVASQFPGFSYLRSSGVDARVVINALQSRTDVKVLSAPRLAVLNNQKATLQVGDTVPIRTQTAQGTASAGAPVVSTIELRDTGVLLEVTPRISDDGNVVLQVTQDVSDVTKTTSSGIDSPTIQRRRLQSSIATRDGATVALGGLIRETNSRGNSGVPLLKDLPLVGELFRTNNLITRRTELLVLLVPRVMRDDDETRALTEDFLNQFNAAAELATHASPVIRKSAN